MADKEFERTIVAGETAIGYLKYNETPAIPRYYELWFTYAIGHNKQLSKAVKKILLEKSKLSVEDTENLYDTFLSAKKIKERVGEVGAQITTELKDVMTLIEDISNSTGTYGESLKVVGSQITNIDSKDQLKELVSALATATVKMAEKTENQEKKLQESYEQIHELNHVLEEIRVESMTDQLTELANRKKFDEFLAQTMADTNISGEELCLMIIDIDHFKKFNDTYGHQTGDQVLCLVAKTLESCVAKEHLAARYGGEEFAVILPNSNLEEAGKLAEQMRVSVMDKELYQRSTNESLGSITISIGISKYVTGETKEAFIERADKCLYGAKNSGRNNVKSELDFVNNNNLRVIDSAS